VVFSLGSVLFVYVAMGTAQKRGNAFFWLVHCQATARKYNREVFSSASVSRTFCNGKIVLLVQPELQECEVGRSRHA
jgi:hypothetical protein